MTSAHIFYIPVILLVGLMAGFFLGQRATEKKLEKRRKKRKRRRAMQNRSPREGEDGEDLTDDAPPPES